MDIIQSKNNICLKNFKNIDLGQIFDCGQCFRWIKKENHYLGIVKNHTLKLHQKDNQIIFENTSMDTFCNTWKNYFDLETDYKNIGESLSLIHPILKKAYKECSGIRILKQDPWETLCSFIISQNNNIPRIKKIISSLCANFGEKTEGGYTFPSAQKLFRLDLKNLEPIKSGFRAKYILDAAKQVTSLNVDFEKIRNAEYSEARDLLMKIKGVGPKVADCVLLYGFHKLEAFPIDVWIKKVMNKFFKDASPKMFGKYAGIAQQYLYHYSRMHPEILE